jgi:hypothetical protein
MTRCTAAVISASSDWARLAEGASASAIIAAAKRRGGVIAVVGSGMTEGIGGSEELIACRAAGPVGRFLTIEFGLRLPVSGELNEARGLLVLAGPTSRRSAESFRS